MQVLTLFSISKQVSYWTVLCEWESHLNLVFKWSGWLFLKHKKKIANTLSLNNPLSVGCILHFLNLHFTNLNIQSEGLFILHHCISKCPPEAMREERGNQQTQPLIFFNVLLKMTFLMTVNKIKLFLQYRYKTIPKQKKQEKALMVFLI